jgi:peroxiredoxin
VIRLGLVLALVVTSVGAAHAAPAAPGFRVKLLDSRQTFDSREHLTKHVVVVRFQASWCRPCVQEADAFARVVQRYRGRRVAFIVLHVQDATTDVRRFVKAHQVAYPVALDPRLSVANRFQVKGTPDTIVIDERGDIAARITGRSAVTRLPRVLDDLLRTAPRR